MRARCHRLSASRRLRLDHLRRFLVAEAGEDSQLDQRRGLRIMPLQLVEGVVDGQQIGDAVVGDAQALVEFLPPGVAAALEPVFGPGLFN